VHAGDLFTDAATKAAFDNTFLFAAGTDATTDGTRADACYQIVADCEPNPVSGGWYAEQALDVEIRSDDVRTLSKY
jgi:hypothetical protein